MYTVQDMVKSFERRGGKPFVSWKKGIVLSKISFSEASRKINNFSKGFLELGLKPKDKVAIFSGNIPEWIILTLSLNNAGLVDVPRGENSEIDEINYILAHSRAKIVIVENLEVLEKVRKGRHPDVEMVLSVEPIDKIKNISYVEELGKKSRKKIPKVKKEDTCSIIYTSGSTGIPKGVELTHWNFISNVLAAVKRLELNENDKFISILPAWHVFERIAKYFAAVVGIETFYTTQKAILDDFVEQEPTVMASVPRIWERIYNGVMKKVKEQSGLKQAFFNVGLKLSIESTKRKAGIDPVRIIGSIMRSYLDKKVFSELREKLGGRFRMGVSGGSKLPDYIDEFFNVADILLVEGYGLTETSPVISARGMGSKALYTVGPLLEGVEGKIIDPETGNNMPQGKEGILYVRGPNVMKGYYRNFEETRRVLGSDGWFDTGDIGYFDKDNNLVITGREKDIVVLSNGENVNPLPLEDALLKSRYILHAVVTGHDWKHLGALIVPNFENLKAFCRENRLPCEDHNIYKALENEKVVELYQNEVRKYVNKKSGFKDYELIREFRFLSEPFAIGKELTATLKLKRRKINELHKHHIDSMKTSIHKN